MNKCSVVHVCAAQTLTGRLYFYYPCPGVLMLFKHRRLGYFQFLYKESCLLWHLVAWKLISFTLLHGLFYLKLTDSSISDEQEPTMDTVEIRCTCRENAKDPSKISCADSRCPCNRKIQPCTRKCRCYNCKNEHNEKIGPQKHYNKLQPHKRGCTCGSASKLKNPNLTSCLAGGRFGCTDECRSVLQLWKHLSGRWCFCCCT